MIQKTAILAIVLVAFASVALPTVAGAQEMPGMAMPAKCTAPAPPPLALAGWSHKAELVSATRAAGLDAALLTPGRAAAVTLHPTRQVAYVTQPEKPGGSVAHGGMLAVDVAIPGTYQVSLDSGAWIDMLKDGKALVSSAHAPGPACTGIRKTVRFPLAAGHYVIQISANAAPTIQVMVSKVP
jgi:hypothetical protein